MQIAPPMERIDRVYVLLVLRDGEMTGHIRRDHGAIALSGYLTQAGPAHLVKRESGGYRARLASRVCVRICGESSFGCRVASLDRGRDPMPL